MDAVFQYRIPELHPLAVHFPLALLIAAAVVASVWMWTGTRFWRHAALLTTLLGTAGAFFAYFTGDSMAEQSDGVPIVEELVEIHETAAIYTLLFACAAAISLVVLSWRTSRRQLDRDPLIWRIAVGLIVVLAAALVAWTGHVGSTMTWGVAR